MFDLSSWHQMSDLNFDEQRMMSDPLIGSAVLKPVTALTPYHAVLNLCESSLWEQAPIDLCWTPSAVLVEGTSRSKEGIHQTKVMSCSKIDNALAI